MLTEGSLDQKALRKALDDRFETHPAVNSEPKSGYRFGGRVHPDRLQTRSFRAQLRMIPTALLRRSRPRKLIVYARPRSGTTLLGHLLGQVPGVENRGELMHDRVLFPMHLPALAAARAKESVFGFKVLSYQLMEVQRVRRPLAFFDKAVTEGFTLIHLRRNTWNQSLSLTMSSMLGVYFEGSEKRRHEIRIDPVRFRNQVAWNLRMLDYEDEVMSHLPHLRLDYESALADPKDHQATVDLVCDAVGHPSGPVQARMRRTGGKDGSLRATNVEELRDIAVEMGLDVTLS